METHMAEIAMRYQGVELGQEVWFADHLQSRVSEGIISGVSLKLCSDGIVRAEYYTLIRKHDGEHVNPVYTSEIFCSEMLALNRLVTMLSNEIKDHQEEEEEVREALVRAKMRMDELMKERITEGANACKDESNG